MLNSLSQNKELRLSITDRVNGLREEVVHAKPILCSERARLVTESYKETGDLPVPIRRAKSLEKILHNMTVHIWDGELIVGSHGSNGRRSAPVFPEFAVDWVDHELDGFLEEREQDTFVVPQKVKHELRALFPFWRGKTVYDLYRGMLPDDAKKARDAYMFSRDLFERNGYGHTVYDSEKLLSVGLVGIIAEATKGLEGLDTTTVEGLQKKQFYEAVIISCNAFIVFAERYANKASELAAKEQDSKRKQELEKIADVCRWVPRFPARDSWEAIQVVSFLQLVIQTETNGDSVCPGRMDQYLYPFYKKDIAEKRFTNAEIQELLDCFWIKLNEIVKVQDTESIYIHPGFPMTPNLTIGGQTPDGKDATNELSFMMLNSQDHIRLTCPQFTVRVHDNSPNEFKLRVAESIKLGTGMPALFGDNGCMATIQKHFPDMPIERVRDYSIVGCVELAPKGFQGRVNGGQLNVARVVDLALNNGVDRLTGDQLGPKTGEAQSFKTYEDFLQAVRQQMAYFVHMQVINAAVVDLVQREYTPHIFLSSLVEGCLETGKDLTHGGSRWGATPILHVGLATASDSVAAVKKIIFEDKAMSFDELNMALNSNFAKDSDKKIYDLVSKAPKYGNDDDFADNVMQEVSNIFFDEIERFTDIDGRPYTSMILTLGGTIPHGWKTGATADGRKSTTPVSDSMSPSNGADVHGPTATILSASKIDQTRVLEGNVLNMKFSNGAFGDGLFMQKFVDLYSTYLNDLNGQEIQFNVVNTADLLRAQDHPEEYKDLIIRVAGYSARFVELSRELQNDIIGRTELMGL